MMNQSALKTMALFQAVSPAQLALTEASGWRRIFAASSQQTFCFFKLNQRYAEMIARQWVLPTHGSGFVLRLTVPACAMQRYSLETVAYDEHLEYRVPQESLDQFNTRLLGEVSLMSVFKDHEAYSVPSGRRPLASLMG